MSPRAVMLVLAACALAGCGHAHTVAAEPQGEQATRERAPAAETPSRTKTGSKAHIEIATSPEATLKPGAARAIQEHLREAGDLRAQPTDELDGPTRKALSDFQRAHGLPATGLPDDATVSKLGLDPRDVFRSGRDAR